MNEADYQRIEAEIASGDSPVGIDAKKTHVLIIAKLEAIERRLDALERREPSGDGLLATDNRQMLENGLAAAADSVDATVTALQARGIDIDDRIRAGLGLLEQLSTPRLLEAVGRIAGRVETLEQLADLAESAPGAIAALADTLDEQVARAAAEGIEVDAALRNGLTALLYLGQRVATNELEALGGLLRSNVLHPRAVDMVGRLGCALVTATERPPDRVGLFGALGRLGDADVQRSTGFLLEFARHLGATLVHLDPSDSTTTARSTAR